jgi:hypothetical protein
MPPIYFVNLLFFNFFDACSDNWVLAGLICWLDKKRTLSGEETVVSFCQDLR